ncbi:MAG: hydrogenase iron-sulfur subunit [Desulfamplus sp.]|nr:hydrogenase iron-sulfur subunit [Desulfamplus sp.]MBF0388847.1 hydrogenase iron-sulfur subunit [Desulfamplus sp.]
MDGNNKALFRADAVNIALENLAIDKERFAIEWVSSAEAPRFAELVIKFTDQIRALGANPLRELRAKSA